MRTRIAAASAAVVAVAATVAALPMLSNAATASALPRVPPPLGVPGRWKLVMDANGSDMYKWHRTLFGDQCWTSGTFGVNKSNQLGLTTSGAVGNCAEVASTQTVKPNEVIETRIKFPTVIGATEAGPDPTDWHIVNWPAFWVSTPTWKIWPSYGEIDIAEDFPDYGLCTTYHYSANGEPGRKNEASTASFCGGITPGWHTYSVVWKQGSLVFYYDGHYLGKYSGSFIRNRPLKIIYDNTSGWPGGQGRSTVLVAWTRVWETRPLRTTTTLKLAHTKIIYGSERSERLTVAVRAKEGTPVGAVTISAGSKTVCKLVVKKGTASCNLRRWQLGTGRFKLRARFDGGNEYQVSRSRAEWLQVSRKP